MRKNSFGQLFFLMVLAAVPLKAYVTSAVLEYTVDDKVGFFLNGSPILAKSDFCAFNFECLSTSDGTLPMELFDPYNDNVLAVEDFDLEGGNISVSYRFTIHLSDGDPIVIWSDPGQAKFLHLTKAQPDPDGWTQKNFDDSTWKPAVQGLNLNFFYCVFPSLPDTHFAGILGTGPYVPRLSHNPSLATGTEDHDLYRSHFRFPNHPAKLQTLINPPQGVAGQKVAVRLVPGPDSSEFTQFNILAWLPEGMQFLSAAPGYKWTPNLRRLSWSYDRRDLKVAYAKMPLASIIDASGWRQPDKALGPFKYGKTRRQLNVPDQIFNDGAKFTANRPAWFKMVPPGVDLHQWRPLILGVVFHSQMRLGGRDYGTTTDSDNFMFNYSFDNGQHEALKDDVIISHGATTPDWWIDGYYDATEDRHWTWEELQNLSVKIEARARGTQFTDLMSSMVATVKYYVPAGASPWFYATVTVPSCATLQFQSALYQNGSPPNNSDPVDFNVNVALCAPTPVPTPTETPIPPAKVVMPTPMPSGGLAMASEHRFGLANLLANPSPITYAGTYISFDVKKNVSVDITLNIYSVDTKKLVRQIKAGSFQKGDNHQIFYNALGDDGNLLSNGSYLFELVAEKNGFKEKINEVFEFTKKRRSE